LGIADDDTSDRCVAAVDNLLRSPLLGGKKAIETADAMIITIVGGQNLEIGEMKKALETLRHSSKEFARIVTGAGITQVPSDKVTITLLAIEYDEKKTRAKTTAFEPTTHSKKRTSTAKGEFHQPDLLPEHEISKGYFEKTNLNIVNGEDLDIPTFQRVGISLYRGK
jgi:cell division GTPase FtsZ